MEEATAPGLLGTAFQKVSISASGRPTARATSGSAVILYALRCVLMPDGEQPLCLVRCLRGPRHVPCPAISLGVVILLARPGLCKRPIWVLLRAIDWAAHAEAALAASRPPTEIDPSHPALVLLRW